ncbi:MAG TPA: hypothetical protein VNH11_12990 [Pirellulales bacterium]|nr:hypothetical protein [Pirellulales bacterium]
MPVIDFDDRDQYDAAVAFLAGCGIGFHTRPPQQLVVRSEDYKALKDAQIIREPGARVNRAGGKKTRSPSKPKTGRAR